MASLDYYLSLITGEYRYQRIASIREVLAYDPNLGEVVARGAEPRTRVISFTVTEAGYYLDPHDRLDFGSTDLAQRASSAESATLDDAAGRSSIRARASSRSAKMASAS